MEPDRLLKRYRRKRSALNFTDGQTLQRSKRAVPHIIYPEILVIVDYDGYRLHGGDNVQVNIEKCIHLKIMHLVNVYIIKKLHFNCYGYVCILRSNKV